MRLLRANERLVVAHLDLDRVSFSAAVGLLLLGDLLGGAGIVVFSGLQNSYQSPAGNPWYGASLVALIVGGVVSISGLVVLFRTIGRKVAAVEAVEAVEDEITAMTPNSVSDVPSTGLWRASLATVAVADDAPPPRQGSSIVGELGAVGLLGYSEGGLGLGLAGGFTLSGQAGGRLSPRIAIVGLVDGDFLFSSQGSAQVLSVGPGVRLGDRHHVTIAIGPAFWRKSFLQGDGRGNDRPVTLGGFAGTLRADVVIVMTRGLSLQFKAAVTANGGGAGVQAGAGLAWAHF